MGFCEKKKTNKEDNILENSESKNEKFALSNDDINIKNSSFKNLEDPKI